MKNSKRTINVKGIEIALVTANKADYISLTDIAKQSTDEPRFVIRNWLTTRNTISYLGEWESLHNPNFDRDGFQKIRNDFFEKPFTITPSRWIDSTNTIGLASKSGRGGGTYAHRDIAINFCYWLSPTFQIYLIKEFQRLKQEESERLSLDWSLKRSLSKVNYTIHTDAIQEELIPPRVKKGVGIIYAGEADILNMAVFGMTAKVWRSQNKGVKGNIREFATTEQLVILSNLEAVNAELIRMKLSQDERVDILNQAARKQMRSLLTSKSLGNLPNEDRKSI